MDPRVNFEKRAAVIKSIPKFLQRTIQERVAIGVGGSTAADDVRVSRVPQNIVSSPARREEDCEDFVGGSVQIVVARSVETVDQSKRVFERRQSRRGRNDVEVRAE